MTPPVRRSLLAWILAAALCASCSTVRTEGDATVRLDTGGPGELGVSTDYGVVFLGRGQKSGRVEFTSWFGDGPSFESGWIEAVGGGLFTTRAEIDLPVAPIRWSEPRAGSSVLVRGRRGTQPFSFEAELARDERVDGLLLRPSSELRALGDGEVGAGIYVEGEDGLALVGLLAGRLELSGPDGPREYFAVVGPRDLWRLSSHARDVDRPRREALREDVLPGS